MLTFYQNLTQQLLENPVPTTPLYSNANLTTYINLARAQLALDSECLHFVPTFVVTPNAENFPFSAVLAQSVSTAGVSGVGSLIAIQNIIGVNNAGFPMMLYSRPWPWFEFFYLGATQAPQFGQPTQWSQLGEGAGASAYLYPTPNLGYSFFVDGVFQPINLVDDTTVEAIPYPFQDAVPFYAAYYAMMTSQRTQDAQVMFDRYKEYVRRGRQISTPTVLPNNFPGGIGARLAASRQSLTDTPKGG